MTSSLVGSEMCIRDRRMAVVRLDGQGFQRAAVLWLQTEKREPRFPWISVSYTHLTLPTICSV
eukprot:10495763-Prorocentrum_lima.AAC.1